MLHKRIESGYEETFEVMKVFADQNKADEYADKMTKQIDQADNDDYSVEEEYWIVPQTVE